MMPPFAAANGLILRWISGSVSTQYFKTAGTIFAFKE
jgi:hypothetical protein